MTIKQLKETIKDLKDDLIVLTPRQEFTALGSGVSLMLAYFSTATVMVSDGVHEKRYDGDFGEKQTKNKKRIDCLIVE